MSNKITTNLQSLGDFRALQVKGNKQVYVYAFVTTIETLEGTLRQVKVGFTASPYEMRCYKRPLSDSMAFLNVRVESPAIAKILAQWGSKKLTQKQAQDILAAMVELPVHKAMIDAGFEKDSENFRKEGFSLSEVKHIIENTLSL